MTIEQSGSEYSVAREHMDVLDKHLDEFERASGLPMNSYNLDRVTYFLELTQDVIEKLTAEDCANHALETRILAIHLQRLYNRERSRYEWAKGKIDKLSGKHAQHQSGYSFQERRLGYIAGDSYASKLYDISQYAQQRMIRIEDISTQISFLSRTFEFLYETRKRNGDRLSAH